MNDSSTKNKRGSSRRKGDEFQDLSALKVALELYQEGGDFEIYLEYEKAKAIDDIVVFSGGDIRAIQAKLSIDPLAVYVPSDFTDASSPVYFGKFAEGWRKARTDYPGYELTVELLSNRGLDSTFERIVEPNGSFAEGFIEKTVRKFPRQFHDELKQKCQFEG